MGLRKTGSEYGLEGLCYGYSSARFKMSQVLLCLWASRIPQLCLRGPVCVLSLHCSLQEACDLHPSSKCTPSQVSNPKWASFHVLSGIYLPTKMIKFCYLWPLSGERVLTEKVHRLTWRQDPNSACILCRTQVKQKLHNLSSVQCKQKERGPQWTQSISKSKRSTTQAEWRDVDLILEA